MEEPPLEIKVHICKLLIGHHERPDRIYLNCKEELYSRCKDWTLFLQRPSADPRLFPEELVLVTKRLFGRHIGDCRQLHLLSRSWRRAALHATTSLFLYPACLCLPHHRVTLLGFRQLKHVQLSLRHSSQPSLAFAWLAYAPLLTSLDVLGSTDGNLRHLESLTGLTTLSRSYIPSGGELHRLAGGVTRLPPFSSSSRLRVLDLMFTHVMNSGHLSQLHRLEALDVTGSLVTSLVPLSGLTALSSLVIDHCRFLDLTPLSSLPALCSFSAWRLPAVWTPVTALTGLTMLRMCAANIYPKGRALSLSSLTRLQSLDVMECQPVPIFTTLTRLTSLDVGDTALTSVQSLSGLRLLVNLSIRDNPVEDLTPLTTLTRLKMLDISQSYVSDLRPLQLIPSLNKLDIANSRVRDGTPLAAMPNLTAIRVAL